MGKLLALRGVSSSALACKFFGAIGDGPIKVRERFVGRALCVMVKSEIRTLQKREGRKEGKGVLAERQTAQQSRRYYHNVTTPARRKKPAENLFWGVD